MDPAVVGVDSSMYGGSAQVGVPSPIKTKEDMRGIIPRAINDIFSFIENDTSASRKYLVRLANFLLSVHRARMARSALPLPRTCTALV
jgi:hypothetical protein